MLEQSYNLHLDSCFVSRTEEPKEFQFTTGGYSVGGLWFCPGCGVLMRGETPDAVRYSWNARRNIGSFLPGLIELHPHRPIDGPRSIVGEKSPHSSSFWQGGVWR